MIGLSGLVLPLRDPVLPDWMETPGDVLYYLAVVFVGVAVVLTLVSGAQFFRESGSSGTPSGANRKMTRPSHL